MKAMLSSFKSPARSFTRPSANARSDLRCRICAQQLPLQLRRPNRPKQSQRKELKPQQTPSKTAQSRSAACTEQADQCTVLESFQEPLLSRGQRWRLQQWVLRAVSSGAYSLSAFLLFGALGPAAAVGEFNPGAGASVTASQPPEIPNPTQGSGLTVFELILIFAPVILYGGFSIYRSKVNQRAKLSDFLFIAAAGVVVANLFTIIVFKKKLY